MILGSHASWLLPFFTRHTAWIVLDTFVGASHFVQYNLYLCWSCFCLEVLQSNPLFCVGFSTHCWNPILVYVFLCFNLTQLYRAQKHFETHDIQAKLVMAGIACFRFAWCLAEDSPWPRWCLCTESEKNAWVVCLETPTPKFLCNWFSRVASLAFWPSCQRQGAVGCFQLRGPALPSLSVNPMDVNTGAWSQCLRPEVIESRQHNLFLHL